MAALDPGGNRQDLPRLRSFAKYIRVALYIAVLIGALGTIALIRKSNYVAGLPSCSASDAISDARAAIESSPVGKTFGLAIIDLRDAREISRSDTEVQCAAMVKLNNATDGEFRYRFYLENGKLFVYAQLPTPGIPQEQQGGCAVTLAQYQQLITGMSFSVARKILVCDGVEMSRSDTAGYSTVMYTWNGSTIGGNMTAMFQNDRLINKAQFGLK